MSPFKLAPSKGDADLQLDIVFYGIHPDGLNLGYMEPMLAVKARIVRPDGTVTWTGEGSIKFPSDAEVKPRTMDMYQSSPELLGKDYARLSDLVALSIMNKLETAHWNGKL